jgi:Carbohydrate esterase, sialic acid-specific acetylesterase
MLCQSSLEGARARLKRLRCAAIVLVLLYACEPDVEEQHDASSSPVGSLDAAPGGLASWDAQSQGNADGGSRPVNQPTSDAGTSASDAGGSSGADASAGASQDAGAARSDGGRPGNIDAGDAGSRPDASSSSRTFHVFLLLGQSNMAGYPKAQAADKVEDPRVRVLGYDDCAATGRRKDVWATAAPPLHECWNGAIGPGDHFAKTLLASLPETDTIGLVPCAVSGERIETFLKVGGSKYGSIVSRAKLAQQAGGVIEGILFHQGESNCSDPQWPNKVKTLVTDLRTELGLGDAPFLAGELAPNGNCASHNPLVNRLPDLIPNAHVVSAQGLAVDVADTQWRLHFDHASQVTFGKRYAQTMIDALRW